MTRIKELLKKQWGDEGMVNYCLKSSTFLDMNGYFLDLLSKPSISKTIYYADTDHSTGKMAKDPGSSFEVFFNRNIRLNSPQRSIKEIEDGADITILNQYRDDKTNGELKSWQTKGRHEEVKDYNRMATPEEGKMILEGLKIELAKYEKRLKTYYKRYGHKVTTSSYWADR